jgi:hypothetical protein
MGRIFYPYCKFKITHQIAYDSSVAGGLDYGCSTKTRKFWCIRAH